jgi:hypothetical protein
VKDIPAHSRGQRGFEPLLENGDRKCPIFDRVRKTTRSDDYALKQPADQRKETEERDRKLEEHGLEFARRNPIKVKNVLDHWYTGTDEEHQQGMAWYPDARATCNVIAEDTGLELYQVAGLVAVYSPQSAWPATIVTAAMVAKSRTPIGGPGSGVMANKRTKLHAEHILSGGPFSDVLKGYKTNAFAHLIFHGGDSQKDKAAERTRVCVDRHAYSVVCGARANDAAYGASGLGSMGRRYEEAANCYRVAAKILSETEGRYIAPHQVQAATWVTRRRLNGEEDMENGRRNRSAKPAQKAMEHMHRYFSEHHPRASLLLPGSGYSPIDADMARESSR